MELHSSYERVFFIKSAMRKIIIFGIYLLFAIAVIIAALASMNIYIAVLGIFAELILVLLTKNYLSVELEYSFIGGVFFVSRIYGKSRRRTIVEIEMKNFISIAYVSDDACARAASLCKSDISDLSAPSESDDMLVAVWEVDKVRHGIKFNADEKTLKILYRVNAQACSQEIRVKAR